MNRDPHIFMRYHQGKYPLSHNEFLFQSYFESDMPYHASNIEMFLQCSHVLILLSLLPTNSGLEITDYPLVRD